MGLIIATIFKVFIAIIAGLFTNGAERVEQSKPHATKKTVQQREKLNKKEARKAKKAEKAAKKATRGESDITEYIRNVTGNECSRICLSMLRGLGMRFSNRYNAKWDMGDFYRFIVSICADAGPRGTAEGQYAQSRRIEGMAQLPSRTWFYNKIKYTRYDYMLSRCMRIVSRTVKRAKRHGMLYNAVDASIDLHDIPLYAKVMNMIFAVSSKKKKGTQWFTRLATIHCVTNGERMTLGIRLVKRKEELYDIVDELLDMCKNNGIHISSLTMDRGFYSASVVSVLKRRNVPFVMPAIKRPGIKTALEKFTKGTMGVVSKYTMESEDKKISEDVTLVITRRPEKKGTLTLENQKLLELYDKPEDKRDKYIPFITNMKFPQIEERPEQIAEFYKRRWGIEVSYKGYEQIRPWTTSTDHSVRIFLLFFPFILYNAWILVNHIIMRQNPTNAGYAAYVRPACALGLFFAIFSDILNQKALELERHRGPPDT